MPTLTMNIISSAILTQLLTKKYVYRIYTLLPPNKHACTTFVHQNSCTKHITETYCILAVISAPPIICTHPCLGLV